VGAALATANVLATTRLGRRAVAATTAAGADPSGVAGRLLVVLMIKMIALFVLVWAAVSAARLEVLPLGLGLAVIVPALVLGGLRFARLAPGADPGQTNTERA
jgi:hypothetical protein